MEQDLLSLAMSRRALVSFLWIVVSVSSILAVAALITDDELSNLLASLASGGVVAAVVLIWERSDRQRVQRDRSNQRRTVLSVTVQSMAGELANIVQLLPDLDHRTDADAFGSADSAESVARAVEEESRKLNPSQSLTINAADRLPMFFARLDRYLEVLLTALIDLGDEKAAESLVGLWRLRSAHEVWLRNTTASGGPPRDGRDLVLNSAQHAGYLAVVADVIAAYVELLRDLERQA